MKMDDSARNDFRKIFYPLFAIPSIVTIIIFVLLFQTQYQRHLSDIKSQSTGALLSVENSVSIEFDAVIAELIALSRNHSFQVYLTTPSDEKIKQIEHDWSVLMESRKVFDQIRFIDHSGLEKIRVNYLAGKALAIPRQKLQDKSDRYYFTDTYRLDSGSVFVSPLDLNVENGRIEEPIKPMIRFGIPVFDQKNRKRGIVVFNYLAERLIDQIRSDTQRSLSGHLMLMNREGFYLSHPNSAKEWGFMYDRDDRFNKDFPDIWDDMGQGGADFSRNDQGLFVYSKIAPISPAGNRDESSHRNVTGPYSGYSWYAVLHTPEDLLSASVSYVENVFITLGVVLALLYFSGAWFLARAFCRNWIERKKMLDQRIRDAQMASIGELATGVAHEINNPINGVINYAQILKNRLPEDESTDKMLNGIMYEGGRVAKIVSNLLSLSRQEAQEYKPLQIEEIISAPLQLLERQLEQDGITVDVSIESDLPEVQGNVQQLEQILINLISNARHALNAKYATDDPGKVIRIEASCTGEGSAKKVQLSVMDQGCGIPAGKINKIFNVFYTTKPAGIGTGLGLSMSYDIVKKHGGTISVESEVGDYTKVVIEFPVLKE